MLTINLSQQVSSEDLDVTRIKACVLPLAPLFADCIGKEQAITFIELLQERNYLTQSKG